MFNARRLLERTRVESNGKNYKKKKKKKKLQHKKKKTFSLYPMDDVQTLAAYAAGRL